MRNTYVANVEDENQEPKITPAWFIPFLQRIEDDRWRVKLFVQAWAKHVKKEGEFGSRGVWCERIRVILGGTPEGKWERAARVVTSIVAWFGYNNGYHFLEDALSKLNYKAAGYDNLHNVQTMIHLWSYQNSLYTGNNGHGGRTLANILSIVKQGDNPLTVEDLDAAECLMMYIATEDGRNFFRNLLKKAEGENKKQREKLIEGAKR